MCEEDLLGAACRQDRELQRPRRNAVDLREPRHKGWQLIVGQRLVVAARAELLRLGNLRSSQFFHRAGFDRSSGIQPSTCAEAITASIRPRRRDAVSGFVFQIGVNTLRMAAVST